MLQIGPTTVRFRSNEMTQNWREIAVPSPFQKSDLVRLGLKVKMFGLFGPKNALNRKNAKHLNKTFPCSISILPFLALNWVKGKMTKRAVANLETDLASRWEGVKLPRASGKSPDFPGSSPNFPGRFSATSPEVLSLWNLTVKS